MKPLESGLVRFNEKAQQFEELKPIPLDARLAPSGHPFRVNVEGQEYFYFPSPYPCTRVKNDWASVTDLSAYEAFTCLKDSSGYDRKNPAIDRGADGKLVWKWRKDTHALSGTEIEQLVQDKNLNWTEVPFRLKSSADGKPIQVHHATVYWNEYLKKWVMIAVQNFGDSVLGEVWFARANAPEGPWGDAVKVATHAMKGNNQDFYNAIQHPYFAQEGGKLIYFEGTLVNTFSGSPHSIPLYNYNQLMYRLDLSSPRLSMPEPPPGLSAARPSKFGP